jgi:phage terminase large subunit-like protein
LRFNAAEAQAAIDFWELCPHLKGERAAVKEDIRLESWQKFVIGSVYGWQRKRDDGTWVRRYKVAWVELGRKNGKTTMIYPAALYALTIDVEEGGEIYATATKKDQAKLVYQLARRAVNRVPEIAEVVTSYVHSLVAEDSFSKFEALGADADTLDGLNPSLAIADEIHKWKGRELWDVIETGMGARRQPLLFAITTAGEEGEQDVYGQEHNYSTQVLDGVIEDDSRFAYIACLDPADNWQDAATWPKANPNLGVSLDPAELAAVVKKAGSSPAAANAVKRLRFGIRGQDEDAWIPLASWDAGKMVIDWERYRGAACGAGMDLASSSDFAAVTYCFPIDDDLSPASDWERPWGHLMLWRLWLPQGWRHPSEKRLRDTAKAWVPNWVLQTEGDVIDHNAIEEQILADANTFDVRLLHYDPYNATQLAVSLSNSLRSVEPFPQTMARFAEPSKRFSESIANGRLVHEGNPAVRWMANNVIVVQNGAGHMMPSRKKSKNKIDGIVSGVMAQAATMAPTNTRTVGPLYTV